ncbi:MAG TPA: hypothetical protein PKD83_07240 [Ignavibacteria bacterium]|nr:hypothetical protein [Ignavibacteria bacterium]
MHSTKLILLLKSLSSQEFRFFSEFVSSPLFNKNLKVISLLNSLKKYYPEFENSNFTNENIYKKVFPGENYNYFKLKNIISDLLALGKEFLAVDHFRNNPDMKTKILLEQYRDRNLDNMFLQLYNAFEKKLDETPAKDEHYFLSKLEITEELKSFYSPKEPNAHFNLFQDQLDFFANYSIIRLLRLYNIMLHETKQNNYAFDMKMLDEVLSYIKNNKNEEYPTILLYYYIILLEKESDEKYFFELKALKEKHFDEFNKYDKYMYFLHMAGYCADVYNNKCSTEFAYEHFLLSKENFDSGTIELGKILYMDFLNHVKIALRVNEFDWAENYINTFKDKLTEEKESTLNFCNAFINYKKGDLTSAMDLLSRTNFPSFIIKIQVKLLLLQINFEMGYFEQALNMIDSFKHYLAREKNFIEYQRKAFNDFISITGDLIKFKTGNNNEKSGFNFEKIKKDIEKINFNQFGIKLWLEDRIKDFE